MKVLVDAELCIGCGLCADSCPDIFVMEEDKAVVKATPAPQETEECSKRMKDDCPVEAINIEE